MSVGRERKRYLVSEVTALLRVDHGFVAHCLRAEWIRPAFPEVPELDEADVARLRLILDLKEGFGVNDEAVPVILHLVDQLHALLKPGYPRADSNTAD
jgi:chaperone modulatory protein CbpM